MQSQITFHTQLKIALSTYLLQGLIALNYIIIRQTLGVGTKGVSPAERYDCNTNLCLILGLKELCHEI